MEDLKPESSAERVALWRALHVHVDAKPAVFEDEVGLALLAPGEDWTKRPDMDPQGTRFFRASIVARARYTEDLLEAGAARGLRQYVILGAGLDSFAQRKPELASTLKVYEVDLAAPQAWKRKRLMELGYGIPEWLRLVPVNFEAGESWWDQIHAAGFDPAQATLVASLGVSLYLTKAAIQATLDQAAQLAPGSTFAMTFYLPIEMASPEEQAAQAAAQKGARGSGTPFLSFFRPEEMLEMGRKAGFKEVEHVAGADLNERYFRGRTDGFKLGNGEAFLLGRT